MNPSISVITLGVSDLERSKRFYGDLGWPVELDANGFVAFGAADGSSGLALYTWDAAAADAGVDPAGSGFRGVTFNYLVRTEERLGEVMAEAERAGATIVKPAERAPWGGASGHFADPDGYLWKVAWSASAGQRFAE